MSRLKCIVNKFLAPMLKEYGFKKNGLNWKRDRGEFIDIINIQNAKFNTIDLTRFTINIGVFSPEAHSLIWGDQRRKSIIEADCPINVRLATISSKMIGEPGTDLWWELDPQTDISEIGEQIVGMINSYALPFLGSFNSYEKIEKYLDAEHSNKHLSGLLVLLYAFVKTKVGDLESAKSILDSMIESKNVAWADKAKSFKKTLSTQQPFIRTYNE